MSFERDIDYDTEVIELLVNYSSIKNENCVFSVESRPTTNNRFQTSLSFVTGLSVSSISLKWNLASLLCRSGASILGGWGFATPRFWAGGCGGLGKGGCGRVVKCYYILSCTGSIFESGDF